MDKVVGMTSKVKVGKCRICRKRRKLDPHHIISRGRAKKIGKESLIRNPGNIVFICRKCHNQTTASLSRYKYRMGGKTKEQEEEVFTVTIESLEAELFRIREENKTRLKEVRGLAKEEIDRRKSEIGDLEEENEELRE